MNCSRENKACCYIHPREVVVGICSICLKEKLLNLACKKSQIPLNKESNKKCSRSVLLRKKKPSISLPKVFAFSAFLHRLQLQNRRSDDNSGEGSIAGLEDSFISIKFEENGTALWESIKTTCSKPPPTTRATGDHEESQDQLRSAVGRANRGGVLRWPPPIGRLLRQPVRWKRSDNDQQRKRTETRRAWKSDK